MSGMPNGDIHGGERLAAGRERPLVDPHAERPEAELGVAHEREQLGDGRQGRWERHDLREAAGRIDGHERGAVPEASGHRGGL
jgi:hypothetical protein